MLLGITLRTVKHELRLAAVVTHHATSLAMIEEHTATCSTIFLKREDHREVSH